MYNIVYTKSNFSSGVIIYYWGDEFEDGPSDSYRIF
jgi:hypothetical protein